MVGLTDGEKILRICVTVYTQYRRVTDRQTDRQTDGQTDRQTSCHGIVRAMHTRRTVKMLVDFNNSFTVGLSSKFATRHLKYSGEARGFGVGGCSGGLGAEPPAGSRGRAPGQGIRGALAEEF